MTQPKLIAGLVLVAVTVGLFAMFRSPANFNTVLHSAITATPTPSPEKRTGTFVDTLVGRIVYFSQGHFYEIMIPNQTVKQIAGVDNQMIESFPAVRPAWSADSHLLAVMVDSKTVAVVTYKTGENYGVIHLDKPLDLKQKISLAFSPDSSSLLLKSEKDGKASLTFFDPKTGVLLYSNEACQDTGVWLEEAGGYATTCASNDKNTIVLITPTAAAKTRTISTSPQYSLLNSYDKSSLVVKRGNDAGKLNLNGSFAMIEASKLKSFPSLEAIRSPEKFLAEKVKKAKNTEAIDDLQVSSDNSYIIYHTAKGLWIVDLRLQNNPYFLMEGSLPSIMP